MIAFVPVLSILMLAVSAVLLDVAFADIGQKAEDFSHLDDPNLHLEDLVTCTDVTPGRLG